VSPFFVEDVHELQLNSLKLISMVWTAFLCNSCDISNQIVLEVKVKSHEIRALLFFQEYCYSLVANGQIQAKVAYKKLSICVIFDCFY